MKLVLHVKTIHLCHYWPLMQIILKVLNDKFGYVAGGFGIKFIAEALQRFSQGSDYAFRIGEEFLLLLVNTESHCAMSIEKM